LYKIDNQKEVIDGEDDEEVEVKDIMVVSKEKGEKIIRMGHGAQREK